jgi:eukaryotic-like serine/threonine-protein kinase
MMTDEVGGDPIDVALVRAATRRKLFGGAEAAVMVSRFVVERRLGAGGMGVVYEARDPELNRKVALKLLHESADAERLRSEARALARLRHPNVVAVHDVGTWQGRVFLTMEHVPGGTLASWLQAEKRSRRDIARVLAAAARALAAAHAAGIVHRDMKPENILVGDDGEVRVVDFGLARHAAAAPDIAAGSNPDAAGGAPPRHSGAT